MELVRGRTWGEPADYFEYVMFANGNCTAPEAVAYGHELKRDLVPTDLSPGYPPAVRFYFDWAQLANSTEACFDGVHLVKIGAEVPLVTMLVAAVIHMDEWPAVADSVPSELAERMVVFEMSNPTPEAWATAALAVAVEIFEG